MKANKHDYDNIFSVCVLYAAHGIFIAIRIFMTNISSVALLNIQRMHVSAYYRIKINYRSQSEVITSSR